MNIPKVSAALNTISLAFGELAEALVEGTNGQIPVSTPATPASPVSAAPEPTEDVLGPWVPAEPVYEAIPLPADAPGLGRCPNHNVAWTVKPAGTSKAGKPYTAFWRCDTRDADGYCSKKPVRSWADAHPL